MHLDCLLQTLDWQGVLLAPWTPHLRLAGRLSLDSKVEDSCSLSQLCCYENLELQNLYWKLELLQWETNLKQAMTDCVYSQARPPSSRKLTHYRILIFHVATEPASYTAKNKITGYPCVVATVAWHHLRYM